MTGMKYIRFRDLHQIDTNKKNELMNTILLSSKPTDRDHRSSVTPIVNSNPIAPPSFDPSTSTNREIDAWFTQHRISSELRQLFDFQSIDEMLEYAELLIKDREKQMNIYSKIYSQQYHGNEMPPHEFNRFANGLEQLLREKRPSSVRSKSAMLNQSSACIIS